MVYYTQTCNSMFRLRNFCRTLNYRDTDDACHNRYSEVSVRISGKPTVDEASDFSRKFPSGEMPRFREARRVIKFLAVRFRMEM